MMSNLVAYELITETQSSLIQHSVGREHDRIFSDPPRIKFARRSFNPCVNPKVLAAAISTKCSITGSNRKTLPNHRVRKSIKQSIW
jgi:hypothetical protein